jgi:hypothetical protein
MVGKRMVIWWSAQTLMEQYSENKRIKKTQIWKIREKHVKYRK